MTSLVQYYFVTISVDITFTWLLFLLMIYFYVYNTSLLTIMNFAHVDKKTNYTLMLYVFIVCKDKFKSVDGIKFTSF